MGRGIFSGLVWGGITGGLVVSVVSLYAPVPQENRSSIATDNANDAPTELDVAATAIATDTVQILDVVPKSDENADGGVETVTEDVAALDESPAAELPVETRVETLVETQTASQDTMQSSVRPTVREDAPAVQARAPQTATGVVTQRVAQAPASDSAVPGRASPLLQGNAEASQRGILLDDDTPTAPERAADVTRSQFAPAIANTSASVLSSAISVSPATRSPGGLAAPLAEATPDADLQTAARVLTDGADAPAETQQEPAAIVTPVSSDTPIRLPVPTIENPVSNVVTNRLPSVVSPEGASATQNETEVLALDASEVGALRAYAAPFADVPATGMFSVIFIDAGAQGMALDELLQLEIPFSIAVDPSAAGAAETAKAYRDAGIEVLAIANDLPQSAGPSDVAVALGGYFDVLDQAIGLLDPLDGRIQNNRDLLQPVLGAIRDTGHGLVTYDRGLNTAQQAARREGIASATVFRQLDADQEQAPRIKRYLSRAAFTASKDGAVVVVGHSYPDTVKAVLEWALDEKTADLSVVPVSQVMLREEG